MSANSARREPKAEKPAPPPDEISRALGSRLCIATEVRNLQSRNGVITAEAFSVRRRPAEGGRRLDRRDRGRRSCSSCIQTSRRNRDSTADKDEACLKLFTTVDGRQGSKPRGRVERLKPRDPRGRCLAAQGNDLRGPTMFSQRSTPRTRRTKQAGRNEPSNTLEALIGLIFPPWRYKHPIPLAHRPAYALTPSAQGPPRHSRPRAGRRALCQQGHDRVLAGARFRRRWWDANVGVRKSAGGKKRGK